VLCSRHLLEPNIRLTIVTVLIGLGFRLVNAERIFPKSAEVKFPTLAGMVISQRFDPVLRFSAAGLGA
jgi:hypothetical protein